MLQLMNLFLSKTGSIKEQKTEAMAAVVAYLMFASYCLTLVVILCLIGIIPNFKKDLHPGNIEESLTHLKPENLDTKNISPSNGRQTHLFSN